MTKFSFLTGWFELFYVLSQTHEQRTFPAIIMIHLQYFFIMNLGREAENSRRAQHEVHTGAELRHKVTLTLFTVWTSVRSCVIWLQPHTGPFAHRQTLGVCVCVCVCVCQVSPVNACLPAKSIRQQLVSSNKFPLTSRSVRHSAFVSSDSSSWDVWVESPPGSPAAPRGVSKHGQDRGVIPGPSGWLRANSPDWVRHLWRRVQGEWEHFDRARHTHKTFIIRTF